ncbi:MAG: cation:dicarboxylase symporter family transporter, partial [Varibaculum cambriense]|nr:cation:dicarboxylase symporter family transporter [Varibaculum cambriense]
MRKRNKNTGEVIPKTSPQVTELTASKPYVPESKKPKKDNTHWLYIGVIIAVIAGIVFGIAAPDVAKEFKVVGTTFVRLITMMIVPVIFCTIVLGIGSVRAAASVGKAGGIALAYFLTMSTFALGIGLVVGNIIEPGSNLNIEATKDAAAQFTSGNKQEGEGIVGFIQ